MGQIRDAFIVSNQVGKGDNPQEQKDYVN